MGLQAACELARRGLHLAIFNRKAAEATVALQQLEAARSDPDQRFTSVLLDVADRQGVLDGFAEAERRVGTPDLVLHLAGLGGAASMETMPYASFDQIMRTNVYGTRHVAEATLLCMRPRGRGTLRLRRPTRHRAPSRRAPTAVPSRSTA